MRCHRAFDYPTSPPARPRSSLLSRTRWLLNMSVWHVFFVFTHNSHRRIVQHFFGLVLVTYIRLFLTKEFKPCATTFHSLPLLTYPRCDTRCKNLQNCEFIPLWHRAFCAVPQGFWLSDVAAGPPKVVALEPYPMTTQHVSLTCLLCFYAQFPSANCATLFWPSTSDVYTSLPDQGIQTLRNDLSFVAAFDLPALRYAVQKSHKSY